ncbi:uracil-DNA glycosylase [Bacteriovorax sp. BSW11_IV]|uniref:uracil-DNA glycosylase n=1 Tax=Bacteriovorax sp. BSW11_IV TaxID=1353529 RepID=UPI00038A13A7|nr:uracil-DNA glycosylase [Bacteriovorax sp. BSW11_IV]EQC48891.1 uracil-DNA glycosylase [Bacteriovorax sp. BSW11_IV]
MEINLCQSWHQLLQDELNSDYFNQLTKFIDTEISSGQIIFPQSHDIFSALNLTPLEKVKVVILGQDPYHGDGQAHGLAFSVNRDIKIPPSLVNIYKELNSDLNLEIPRHGCLESWAKEGVLLLNNVLTVQKGMAGSHHKKGWEKFTDKIIEIINEKKENVVFILWGSPAQKKASKVNTEKHFVITSVHPSPLSSYRGFFGSKPFSKANDFLVQKSLKPINWNVPNS